MITLRCENNLGRYMTTTMTVKRWMVDIWLRLIDPVAGRRAMDGSRAGLSPRGPHAKFVGSPFQSPLPDRPIFQSQSPTPFSYHSVITENRLNLIILFSSELAVYYFPRSNCFNVGLHTLSAFCRGKGVNNVTK